jgi:hypothetical protein
MIFFAKILKNVKKFDKENIERIKNFFVVRDFLNE